MNNEDFKNKILLVEDNPINIKLAVAMLERLGIEVEVATNGQEAIDKIEAGEKYNLILMDLQMPVLDGVATTRHLIKHYPHCPSIVAMTANVDPHHYNSCMDAGMQGFIEKPIRLNKLKEVLPLHLPTLHIAKQKNDWLNEVDYDGTYQHIDHKPIETDYSECWDIFYKFYRDFIIYYQNDLPQIEFFLRENNSMEALKALIEFSDLAVYLHPTNLQTLVANVKENSGSNDFGIAQANFKLMKREAQEIIREVSLLLRDKTQKMSQ